MAMLGVVAVVLIGLVFVARGIRRVREDERLVILRLGRYLGVRGPGLVVMLPLVDGGMRVALDKEIPGWRGMSAERLEEAVRQSFGFRDAHRLAAFPEDIPKAHDHSKR